MIGLIDPKTWANNYIEEYLKNNEFDPFRVLEGKDKPTKIYCLCCNYLAELKTKEEETNKNFITELNRI